MTLCSVKEEVVTLTGMGFEGSDNSLSGSRCFGESKGEENRPNIRWHKCWVCCRLLFSHSAFDGCLKQRNYLTDFLKVSCPLLFLSLPSPTFSLSFLPSFFPSCLPPVLSPVLLPFLSSSSSFLFFLLLLCSFL